MWSRISILLKTIPRGNLDLYKIDKLYSILLIKVFGFSHLTVSATYKHIVGKLTPRDSVIICPEADWENASIYPGVSIITKLKKPKYLKNELTQ